VDRTLLRFQNSRLSGVEKISAWMQQCMPSTSVVSLIHNDYKYDNVVLDSSDITRIIASSIGDVHHRRLSLRFGTAWILGGFHRSWLPGSHNATHMQCSAEI